MSLEKNLIKPARKAWKAFTYKLCSNFHNLHLATSSVKATARRVSDFCSFRLFKRRFHTRASYNKRHRRRRRRYEVLEYCNRGQYGGGKTEEVCEQRSETGPSMEEAWEVVVAAAASQLTVDEKAEEFISRFRQEMNLEKEKSLAEFHEMLARGA